MVRLPPRRTPRTWLRAQFNMSLRLLDGWNDLTDRMQPPDESLQEFLRLHTEVRGENLPWLWEAFLQWVRVYGRFGESGYPPRLCQPALAVDDLWRLLFGDVGAWRELPEHVQVMQRVPVREADDRTDLFETYEQAYLDEYGSLRLPVLFRVDEILGLHEGRLYRAECVIDGPEKSDTGLDPEPGRTCMHQIPWFANGVGK